METNKDADTNEFCVNQSESNLKEDGAESTFSGYFKKSKGPRSGGSIINLLEDVVKVGHVMGYNMEGCLAQKAKKDWVKDLSIKNKVNILALQETKMENMSLLCVKSCWGNMTFDFVHSDSVGNSGGILCVWDPNAFRKNSVTLSDYFILVRGVWEQNGMDLLIVVVYAPHDAKEKIMLWDYLASEINRWRGKVVVMVELGGCSFTWCHKTAKKMSKLDRFLVSDNLLHTYPHLSAISLERFLSDHRPILLREHHLDYGPTPFRFFHYWCEIDGFKNLVEDAWKDSPNNEGNAMLNLMGKFKFLKTKIRIWNKKNMANQKNVKSKLITDLDYVEAEIDRGIGNEEIVAKHMNLVKNLQDINNLNSMEMAQKSNVKWAVEGEENSSFFHGTINKKGMFLRFAKPDCSRATLHSNFPNRLTSSQQSDLDRDVSKDEIKRAVWDCGTDKSPGPDGFTFGFYRRFWYLIENDVYKAVSYFFLFGDIPKAQFDHEVQSAFVKDRQILDGPFILDELIQWCKKKRKHLLVFKVDFEKAFDSVRWDFLDDLLFKFGFGGKWRKWIQSCLRSSRGSIILNGSPTEEFQFHKEAGLFNGIQLNSSINISHLFYADDAVFVGQWCEKNINTLVYILECFFRASGLRINMSKSKLMGLNVDNGKIKEAALKLGCLTLKPPFTYLGSTVGGSMSRIQAWDGVVERVKSRLSKWKMSIHKAPLGVLRNPESLRSHFFNGSAPNNQKASWVNWKNALASKDKGGLGISSLYALNRGLMFKWYWRFFTKDSSLWSRRSLLWMKKVSTSAMLFCFKLGNELCKDCTVASKIYDYTFDSSFRRPPRGGVEQEQFMALLSLVKDIQLVPMEDRWSWSLSSSGEFSVSSVRRLIDDKTLPDATQKTRWVCLVPIKINVHAWKVKSNSLPTRFNISRRGILIDSLKCGTCDMGVETVNHLFFSCTLVRNLVDLIVRWWNVTRVDIDSYSDWDLWIQNLRLLIKNKRMLEGVFYIMWWRSPMIDAATSDEDNKVTPVYKLDEICQLLRNNPNSHVKQVSQLILTRLQHKSPALRVIKYTVGKSGVEFRREMQKNSAAVRQLIHYRVLDRKSNF
ncbi:RNA-directed DNA polymerase, eukaryota [Tanacetum coccineum]